MAYGNCDKYRTIAAFTTNAAAAAWTFRDFMPRRTSVRNDCHWRGYRRKSGGVGGMLLEQNACGDYLPVYDGNGNIIAYKNDAGNVVSTYAYDPFGNVIAHAGMDFTYKFSTKPQDELSGLYYYGYRYYQPIVGRWINRDPIRENGGRNIYKCRGNDLLNYFDLLGLAGNVTHGTESCNSNDCCAVLADKANKWINNYAERNRELIADKYNYKVTDPVRYNNHITEVENSIGNVQKCIALMIKKCKSKDPSIKIPRLYRHPVPQRVPVNNYDINWKYVLPTIGWGLATLVMIAIPFDGPAGEAVTGTMTLRNAALIFL